MPIIGLSSSQQSHSSIRMQALGLKSIVDFSWETVMKEKPDMIHLLDFPYNGETKKDHLLLGKITDNMHHL